MGPRNWPKRAGLSGIPPGVIALRASARALALGAACLIAAGGTTAGAAPPSPAASELAERLAQNDVAMRQAIDEWHLVAGDPPAGQAPAEVMEAALFLQRKVRTLANHDDLAKGTIRLLPGSLAGQVRALTASARDLRRLSGGGKPRKLKTGKPLPLAELVGHYERAERRYAVGGHYLAAINLVETKFGRVKSKSVAGARGPMQFIPSTWRIHGNGGNVHDPADAIPAAARLLRSHGAPRSYPRALYHYNPSRLYVSAVTRYAKLIARDPYAIGFLYCWGP
jgi:membrane-bound lytic murein transglycosylase B